MILCSPPLENVWGTCPPPPPRPLTPMQQYHFCNCILLTVHNLLFKLHNLSSVESQKGAINIQRCSDENQKGAITVQSLVIAPVFIVFFYIFILISHFIIFNLITPRRYHGKIYFLSCLILLCSCDELLISGIFCSLTQRQTILKIYLYFLAKIPSVISRF